MGRPLRSFRFGGRANLRRAGTSRERHSCVPGGTAARSRAGPKVIGAHPRHDARRHNRRDLSAVDAWVSAALSNTARRWAPSLARCGCLVFYSDSQRLAAGENTFTEVETRIFAANAPLEVYAGIKAPIVVATSSNLDQLRHFRDPLVLYECAEEVSENESDRMGSRAEWLARAAVVTVSSEKLYESIASQRPDAVLMPESQLSRDDRVPAILERLKSTLAEENDPAHLRAMLAWREQQVHTLWRQIREQNHPAVEILQDAVTELKRVLAERVDGIAFLRSEVAAREKIIDERGQAVEFLNTELAQREGATTFLRHEIESRDEMILERQKGDRISPAGSHCAEDLRHASARRGGTARPGDFGTG